MRCFLRPRSSGSMQWGMQTSSQLVSHAMVRVVVRVPSRCCGTLLPENPFRGNQNKLSPTLAVDQGFVSFAQPNLGP